MQLLQATEITRLFIRKGVDGRQSQLRSADVLISIELCTTTQLSHDQSSVNSFTAVCDYSRQCQCRWRLNSTIPITCKCEKAEIVQYVISASVYAGPDAQFQLNTLSHDDEIDSTPLPLS